MGSKTDQRTTKSLPKTYPKISTNFLLGVPKRVLPRDSHYFLLDPITTEAFLQSQNSDDDAEYGAPAAATYESKSGGIMDVLEDIRGSDPSKG